jgi:uncharacterized protein YrzB (UPF0473 family)
MVNEDERVVLVDDDGREHEFVFIEILTFEGESYAVLAPGEELESDDDEMEAVILKIGKDENGEDILFDIDDDEEWEKVVAHWQQMMEEEEE